MDFDDYNYKMYNEYVLLTGPNSKQAGGKSSRTKSSVLNEDFLSQGGDNKYVHEAITIEPS
jgi:hypothetical protein